MTSLDDLRTTLHRHAGPADALDPGARSAQVRARVRSARRRRVAGAVAAAVAVVAAVAAPTLLPDDGSVGPADVPTGLAGHTVPPTLESAGWTYEYAGSVTGEDVVELDLDASDEPRLVAWANETTPAPGDLDAWKVVQPDGVAYQPDAADFSQYWRASEGLEGTFRFHGPGESALAVYELSGERPPGVTVEGLTFRERVAGDRLVAADAVRGEASLTMRLTVPEGTLRFGAFCTGHDGPVELALSLDGDLVTSGSSCEDETPFDPGTFTFASFSEGLATDTGPVEPGDVLEVEVRMRDEDGGLVDAGADTLLAASFYEVAEPFGTELAGQPVPTLVEHEGVTWELERTETFAAGDRADRGATTDEPSLAWVYVSGVPDEAVARISVDGKAASRLQGGIGSLGGLFVPTGSRVDVRMEGAGAGSRHSWGAAYYTRAD